jgi:hypothetical protein
MVERQYLFSANSNEEGTFDDSAHSIDENALRMQCNTFNVIAVFSPETVLEQYRYFPSPNCFRNYWQSENLWQ